MADNHVHQNTRPFCNYCNYTNRDTLKSYIAQLATTTNVSPGHLNPLVPQHLPYKDRLVRIDKIFIPGVSIILICNHLNCRIYICHFIPRGEEQHICIHFIIYKYNFYVDIFHQDTENITQSIYVLKLQGHCFSINFIHLSNHTKRVRL